MSHQTASEFAAAAKAWTASTSSSEREKRRKLFLKVAEEYLSLPQKLNCESAAAFLSCATPLLSHVNNKTRHIVNFVLALSIRRVLGPACPTELADTEALRAAFVGSIGILTLPQMPQEDTLAAQTACARFATQLGAAMSPGEVAAALAPLQEAPAALQKLLDDAGRARCYAKRTFTQTKSAVEEQADENAAFRFALIELIDFLSTIGFMSLDRVAAIVGEPAYKARDFLVARAALSALCACKDYRTISTIIPFLPQQFKAQDFVTPPTKLVLKAEWQKPNGVGRIPLWDPATCIVLARLCAWVYRMEQKGDGAQAFDACFAILIHHPSVDVFLSATSTLLSVAPAASLNLLDSVVSGGATIGQYIFDRLLSLFTSPQVGTALEMLEYVAITMCAESLRERCRAVVNNTWFTSLRGSLQHVFQSRPEGTDMPMAWACAFAVLKLRCVAGLATPPEIEEFYQSSISVRFMVELSEAAMVAGASRVAEDFVMAPLTPMEISALLPKVTMIIVRYFRDLNDSLSMTYLNRTIGTLVKSGYGEHVVPLLTGQLKVTDDTRALITFTFVAQHLSASLTPQLRALVAQQLSIASHLFPEHSSHHAFAAVPLLSVTDA